MSPTKRLIVSDLEHAAEKAAMLAQIGRVYQDSDRLGVLRCGMDLGVHYCEFCLGWIWRQWLSGTSGDIVRSQVQPLVERGLELRKHSCGYQDFAKHDLLLLNCVILSGDQGLTIHTAESVSDASGYKGDQPLNNGELYAAAWCGMMKFWILGDEAKAAEHAALLTGAKRDTQLFAAPKSLYLAWLKKDWKRFVEEQQKDFDKLWARARKDAWTVQMETESTLTVRTDGYRIGHMWCWAHCSMAILAHRLGVKVATDPFWFPAPALPA